MSKIIFVDTSGFYALLVKQDDGHHKAEEILHKAARDKQCFVTTDYVLDETATLLRARGLTHLTSRIFDTVFNSEACGVAWMDQERFMRTRAFFLKHVDHPWSFTDCASFIIMEEMKLSLALTKDKHFKEAGFIPLLFSTHP